METRCGMPMAWDVPRASPAGSGEQQPQGAPYGFAEAVPRWQRGEILGWGALCAPALPTSQQSPFL